MKTIFVGLILLSAIVGAVSAQVQGTQPPASLAVQQETCRQNVLQLTEQSKGEQTALAKLRAERKTLGVSGGEVVRYKLANLDQEIKEHSRKHQTLITQIETENKRCDALTGKPAAGARGSQTQAPGRKP